MARQTHLLSETANAVGYFRVSQVRTFGKAMNPRSIGPKQQPEAEVQDLIRRPGTILYYENVSAVTGFILAGGKSSRMGCDKSFLVLGGRTLLERAIELVRSVSAEVRIVGASTRFLSFGTVVNDVFPERGPLGGIHAALASSCNELNLVVGVDLPFLEGRFLSYLVAEAQNSQAVVTVPRIGNQFQPLCAVYRKAFLAPAEVALSAGRNKVDALFSEIALRVIDDNELTLQGHKGLMFSNLNTPQDWEWVQRENSKHSSGIPAHDR